MRPHIARLRAIAAAAWAACLGASLGGAAELQAQTLRVTVEPSEPVVHEQAVLTVTVEGGGRTEPTLPPLPGFNVGYGGVETQISMVNGRFSRRLIYRWVLVAKEAGDFEIGPMEVEVDGEVRRSEPVKLRVLPASAQRAKSRDVFVTANVSNARPYVGEQVLYVWRFYTRTRVADPRLDSLDLGGFLVEDLGAVRQFRTTEGGADYEVSEIRKALFAQRPGTITIPPARLLVQLLKSSRRGIDPFGGGSRPFDEIFGQMRSEALTLVTEPITVTVRALPPSPAGFSGLVGDFTIDSSINATEVPVGESLTQKIVVSGSGNLHLMGDLALDYLDGFKVYRDQPAIELERSGARLQGKKTFTRALVPLGPGEVEIPETRLTYFDPARETYVTAAAPAIVLDVMPGSGNEDLRLTESLSPSGGKVAVRILADDLLPIHRGLEPVQGGVSTAAIATLLAVPPLAFLGLLLARRRADRLASDVGLRRRRGALRRALDGLGRGGELQPRDASSVLRRYIGDRVGAEGGALTARECAERLAASGAGSEAVAEVGSLLARLEADDFGGGGGGATLATAELRGLLERLERELRRER